MTRHRAPRSRWRRRAAVRHGGWSTATTSSACGSGRPRRVTAMTRAPSARKSRAISRPIGPKPTTTIVLDAGMVSCAVKARSQACRCLAGEDGRNLALHRQQERNRVGSDRGRIGLAGIAQRHMRRHAVLFGVVVARGQKLDEFEIGRIVPDRIGDRGSNRNGRGKSWHRRIGVRGWPPSHRRPRSPGRRSAG